MAAWFYVAEILPCDWATHWNTNEQMLPKDLVALIQKGAIEKMIISRPSPNTGWAVSAHGRAVPTDVVGMIELNAEGSKRLWADLDAAYAFIRKCGFPYPVLIDG